MLTFGEPLKHVITLRRQNLVSCVVLSCVLSCVLWCVTLKNPPCPSPCVPAPRAHVSKHVRVLPVHTVTFWKETRRVSACHTTTHNSLGKFDLHGIPSAPRGVPQVEIDFTDTRHSFDAWPALKGHSESVLAKRIRLHVLYQTRRCDACAV